MSSLNDLPGFGKPNNNENDYDFGGFDDFDESGGSDSQKKPQNKFSNAERFLDDFENEQRDGFKVEVKRDAKGQS